MERIPKSGEFYRHFKDKLYQIITVAEHSEDGQKLVIYQALYGEFKTYARPLEMFISEVDHEKYPDVKQKYRFERVEFTSGATTKIEGGTLMAVTAPETAVTPVTQSVTEESVQKVSDAGQQPVIESADALTEEEPAGAIPDAGLIEFLDEEDWDMKYNILVSLRDKMTDKLVDDLAVALDVVIPEGPLDTRYEQLKICLRTRQKYESQHLR